VNNGNTVQSNSTSLDSPVFWNRLYCGDSRSLDMIPDESVHLIVTSPPYNVGKKYSSHEDALPLPEYLSMLEGVWEECRRILVRGGRICVNVAGVDRQPYIPLQSYITQQLLALDFLMRGEIIWNKSASVGVSTAWGSWCRPTNPTLRDVHEYILVFCKESFQTSHRGESDLESAQFVQLTKSIWEFPTASAKKIGHPAPFPLELPARLINLFTFKNDVVLDPFMGSGTTCLAAKMLGRRWVGIDIDESYVRLAYHRLQNEVSKSYLAMRPKNGFVQDGRFDC
jgi:DNA modification methylase